MAGSCGCLRVEDLGPLRDFIERLGDIERQIKIEEIRKRAEIEDVVDMVDMPPDEKQGRLLDLEIKTKKDLRYAKVEEYKRLIEKHPQLCDAASGYLRD